MNLRVRILHFAEGVVISGRQSVAAEQLPGVPCAKSIRRVPDGYLIEFAGKLYVVHDAQVKYAEVADADAEAAGETVPMEETAPSTFAPKPAAAAKRTGTPESELVPGEMAVDDFGRFYRVPFPNGMNREQYEQWKRTGAKPAALAAAPEPEEKPRAAYAPKKTRKGPAPSKTDEE